jgi:hypothetical protein
MRADKSFDEGLFGIASTPKCRESDQIVTLDMRVFNLFALNIASPISFDANRKLGSAEKPEGAIGTTTSVQH